MIRFFIAIAAGASALTLTTATMAGSLPPLEVMGARTGMTPAQFKAAVAPRHGAKIVEDTTQLIIVPHKSIRSKPFPSIITSDFNGPDVDRDRVSAIFTAPPNETRAWAVNRELAYRNPVGPGFDQTIKALTEKFGKPHAMQSASTQRFMMWAWQHDGTPAPLPQCSNLANRSQIQSAIDGKTNDVIDTPDIFAQAAKADCARVISVMVAPYFNNAAVGAIRMVAVDFEAGSEALKRTAKMVDDTIAAERAKDAKATAGQRPEL